MIWPFPSSIPPWRYSEIAYNKTTNQDILENYCVTASIVCLLSLICIIWYAEVIGRTGEGYEKLSIGETNRKKNQMEELHYVGSHD